MQNTNQEHVYGAIPNIKIGHVFTDRAEAHEKGIHKDRTKGIVTYQGGPAYSVDISAFDKEYSAFDPNTQKKGKYANCSFANYPDIYIYIGEGGTDDKVHYCHQTLTAANRGLLLACEQNSDIRVITKEDSRLNSRTYKGLFKVKGFIPGFYDGYFAFKFILCSNENSWNEFINSPEYTQLLSGEKIYTSIDQAQKYLKPLLLKQVNEDNKNVIKAGEYDAKLQVEAEKKFNNHSDLDLFNLATQLKNNSTTSKYKQPSRIKKIIRYEYSRNPAIVTLRLRMSKGICGLCDQPGPFIDPSLGYAFLEVHHIKWLSKQGDDSIENTVGLCPNCHTKVHFCPSSEAEEKMRKSAKRDYDAFVKSLKHTPQPENQ